jgi:RNA polymerase sigma-70 factor (ECF subfamily)
MVSREISPAGDRASEGDRTAFSRGVDRHAPGIWRLARRLAASRADAEDLFQETFLRAWRGIRRFRGEAGLSTWLTRILLNVELDRRRRNRVRSAAPPRRTGPGPDPADQLARREWLDRVLEFVDGLPRRQRECLLLRARAGLPIREVAEMMRIRPAAVKAHLVQARRKLLRRFGREAKEWGLTKD